MRLAFYLLFSIISLAAWSSPASDKPLMKSARTTTYKAVEEKGKWVTGAVVARIHYVKFDQEERKKTESSLEPDGAANSKIVYYYDENGRIVQEALFQGKRQQWTIFTYGYDDNGRIVGVTEKNIEGVNSHSDSIVYDEAGRIAKRIQQNYKKGITTNTEIAYRKKNKIEVLQTSSNGTKMKRKLEQRDTVSLSLYSEANPDKFVIIPKESDAEYDGYGNWIKLIEYNNGVPELILLRDIEYEGRKNDLDAMPLRGKVRSVQQFSYLAVSKGPKSVVRGKKSGNFFYYMFNNKGYKISEDIYSDKGILTGKIAWEYDDDNNIVKEIRKTPANKVQSYTVWKYKNGSPSTKTMYDANDNMIRKCVLRNDLEGNCVSEIWYNADGSVFSEFRYQYDSYGQQIASETVSHQEGGANLYSTIRSWSFEGRMLAEQVNLLPGTGRNFFTYTYNSKGDVISGTEQLNGKPKITYKYKFDHDNKDNWKVRIKYVNDVPVLYEERRYTYYK